MLLSLSAFILPANRPTPLFIYSTFPQVCFLLSCDTLGDASEAWADPSGQGGGVWQLAPDEARKVRKPPQDRAPGPGLGMETREKGPIPCLGATSPLSLTGGLLSHTHALTRLGLGGAQVLALRLDFNRGAIDKLALQ